MTTSVLHRNPERIAWLSLLTAFAVLVVLSITVPLAVRAVIRHASVPLPAYVSPIKGTPLMWERADEKALGVTTSREIGEQIWFRCDEASSAMLTVGENEVNDAILVTVQLYNSGELAVSSLRQPRFELSQEPYRVVLEVREGRARVSAARPTARRLDLIIRTPHSLVHLDSGSYSVEVRGEETEVAVRYGKAEVEAAGETSTVGLGQRTVIRWGLPPAAPMPAERNLVVNGNFTESLGPNWQRDTYQQSAEMIPGTAEIVVIGGRTAVLFSRRGEEGIHTETGISQVIDQDVQDFDFLNLRLDVRLVYQSLPGGGYLSSEFPLMVRLDYTDIYGKEQFWVHGFYMRDPGPEQDWPILGGEKIAPMVWYPYESGNLLQLLQATRPARINSIRIYASGHNYESLVAEVGLTAR